MRENIITTIKMMRSNTSTVTTREKDKKPSINEIYEFLKEKNNLISEEEYLESIRELEDEGIIYKREGRKYYRLNDENTIGDTDLNLTMESDSQHSETVVNKDNFPSEVSLVDMIKENMLREKLQDQEQITFLKDQIKFYQSELQEKNKIITSVLTKLYGNENIETSLENRKLLKTEKLTRGDKNNVNELADINDKAISKKLSTKDKLTPQQPNNEGNKILKIEIIGDSHLNALNPKGLSKHNNIIVRNHPGSTTEDLKSFIVPSIKKQRDVIIIHSGSNDISSNDADTIDNLQSIINKVKKQSSHTKLAISSILTRKDVNGYDRKVVELNSKLKVLCDANLIDFISHDNISEKFLGVKKLHLSKSGTSLLAGNFIQYMKRFY